MKRLAVVVALLSAVLSVVLLPGVPAWAHNRLLAAEPSADAVLTGAPRAVSLRFAERLNPDFTTIVVSDGARRRVATGEPEVDGATGVVTLREDLANGPYTVAYRVVSSDGHAVQGSYTFNLDDPGKPAAASTTVSVAAAASGGPSAGPLIGLGAAVVVAAGFLVLRRRRKTPGTNRLR
ncbi:copper resistance CopC family protein [Actinoplanes regularis]|uniref:CopC domain-containing protein n=1 Tax=Actinoplanes regularis TaxID=52697 RepID=A0A239HT48_9ACTN|nr:copper resistance CopC family protein [Actinoplanes regularis]GIE91203.1 hypothetical protein Are01nite_76830 [Actinoplanes regularis]SNS84537.1 hypothetical protein SAMN06264365_12615 [Actinoplanes regularis]